VRYPKTTFLANIWTKSDGRSRNIWWSPPWLNLHLPSSRHTVPTGYLYVLPDQNGWRHYLHFQAAWLAVGTGLLYALFGFFAGHFWRNLFPAASPNHLRPSAQVNRQFLADR
jgi:thiosulfate reductase cytochrome b subunit